MSTVAPTPRRGRVWSSLFGSPLGIAITALYMLLAWWILPPLVNWAVLNATFLGDARSACTTDGACWVFLNVWSGQILFGRFPLDERWRLLMLVGFLFAFVALLIGGGRRGRQVGVFGILIAFPILAAVLPSSSLLGPRGIDTALIGGLSLNIILAVTSAGMAFILGTFLALARQSDLPVVSGIATVFIEVVRGVPLIAILFAALLLMPLLLPQDWKLGTLLRAYLALSAFYAAYIAEVIRGGLQTVPRSQVETAMALGLGYWRIQLLVVLPQAYRKVLPALVNTFIDLFKDTTLVSLIGIFDVLGVVTNILRDLEWQGLSSEAYFFVALVYFLFCQLMSSYGAWLERQGDTSRQ